MGIHRNVTIGSLNRSAWHMATTFMKVGFPAFFLIGGLYLALGHELQRALGVGLVFPVVLGSVAGIAVVRAARQRHRVRTLTAANLRMALFAGAWAAAWSVPFVLAIGLQELTFQPYSENAVGPLAWGAACFIGAALPAVRS